MADQEQEREKQPDAGDSSSDAAIRTITSEDLLQGEKEVHILHGDEIYRLRLTRNGKLILYK